MRFMSGSGSRWVLFLSAAVILCLVVVLWILQHRAGSTASPTTGTLVPRSHEQTATTKSAGSTPANPSPRILSSSVAARVVSSETKLDAVPPGKVVLEVRFVDEISKRPITSGRVTVEPFYGPDLDVDLNNDGAVMLEADPGSYTLRSSCPGYNDWSDGWR